MYKFNLLCDCTEKMDVATGSESRNRWGRIFSHSCVLLFGRQLQNSDDVIIWVKTSSRVTFPLVGLKPKSTSCCTLQNKNLDLADISTVIAHCSCLVDAVHGAFAQGSNCKDFHTEIQRKIGSRLRKSAIPADC